MVWPLRGVAIALFGQSFVFFFALTFVAMRRAQWQFMLVFSGIRNRSDDDDRPCANCGRSDGCRVGRAVGYCFGALIGALFVLRVLGRPRGRRARRRATICIFAVMAGVDHKFIARARRFFSQLDVLLVGALLGASAAGIYAAPLKLAALLLLPRLGDGQRDRSDRCAFLGSSTERRGARSGLRYLMILQTATAVTIFVWAEPLTHLLLGSQFEGSAAILRALTPYIFLSGIGPLATVSVNYLGEARRRVPIAVGSRDSQPSTSCDSDW